MERMIVAAAYCLTLLLSAGCGNVDSYDEYTERNPAWITIDTPSEASYIETRSSWVDLLGTVFIAHIDEDPYARESWYLIPRDTGVTVSWENQDTEEGGITGQAAHAICYGGYYYATYCYWNQLWGVRVDLAIGENRILVTAEDDSGHLATDSITVNQPLLHVPLINSFALSILSSTSLVGKLEIDTGGLESEALLTLGSGQSEVVRVPAEPVIAEVVIPFSGLEGDDYLIRPEVSNAMGTETADPVDSKIRYPDVWDFYVYHRATYNYQEDISLELSVYTGGMETRVWFDWRVETAECEQGTAYYQCKGSFGGQLISPSDGPVAVTAYKNGIYRDTGYIVVQVNLENDKGKATPVCSIPSQDGDMYVTCH